MACTDAGKPRAGIEQIVCTSGQPLTSSAESSSIAPQRWNLPMYEPSPPLIIPNFSFRGLRCDHCIRDAADSAVDLLGQPLEVLLTDKAARTDDEVTPKS